MTDQTQKDALQQSGSAAMRADLTAIRQLLQEERERKKALTEQVKSSTEQLAALTNTLLAKDAEMARKDAEILALRGQQPVTAEQHVTAATAASAPESEGDADNTSSDDEARSRCGHSDNGRDKSELRKHRTKGKKKGKRLGR